MVLLINTFCIFKLKEYQCHRALIVTDGLIEVLGEILTLMTEFKPTHLII